MIAFASHQFALRSQDAHGNEDRAHLEQLVRFGDARARALLDGPPLPAGYAWIWEAFVGLDAWRGGGGMGMSPLTLHDIAAYERRYGVTLPGPVCDLVKRLDAARLAALVPRKKGGT